MEFLHEYLKQIISTGVLILIMVLLRVYSRRAVRRYAKTSEILEHRTNLVLKYLSILFSIISLIAIFIIWGVQPKDIVLTVSSLITVVGVALIADWSILSNITSGIIILFSFPFKIGDTIKVHDKDYPVEGEIDDIRAFHTIIITKEGEIVSYPNNQLLKKGVSIINPNAHPSSEFTD